MKKLFFVLFAFVALSFTACKSGEKKTETMDTTQKEDVMKEIEDSLNNMPAAPMDTSHMDTSKKM